MTTDRDEALARIDAERARRIDALCKQASVPDLLALQRVSPQTVRRIDDWYQEQVRPLFGRDPRTGELTAEARRQRRQVEAPSDREEVDEVATKTKGKARATRKPGPVPQGRTERDAAIARDYTAGASRDELATKYRLSKNTVGRILWEQDAVKQRAKAR